MAEKVRIAIIVIVAAEHLYPPLSFRVLAGVEAALQRLLDDIHQLDEELRRSLPSSRLHRHLICSALKTLLLPPRFLPLR